MPQKYHVVKALSILCTWPLPLFTDMTEEALQRRKQHGLGELDPTFMYSGIMMQTALQIGLHRPLNSMDFVKHPRDVPSAEITDRELTWAVCNIVTQRYEVNQRPTRISSSNTNNSYSSSLSNGQPTSTIYNWNLAIQSPEKMDMSALELSHRLQVSKFQDKVGKLLYTSLSDLTSSVPGDEQIAAMISLSTEVRSLDNLFDQFSRKPRIFPQCFTLLI